MLPNDISKKLTWWEEFIAEKANDEDLKEIFDYINVVDNDTTKENIEKLRKMVDSLDKTKHKEDIQKFERKIKIFEKRLERKISESFGSLIKHLREEKSLSLAELGELTGISPSYINRIELGERKAPSYPIIEKLAKGLGVSTSTLIIAARVDFTGNKDAKTLTELIFSNNVCLREGEEGINANTKKQLAEIIEYIINMDWKENKHKDMVRLIELLDEFKK